MAQGFTPGKVVEFGAAMGRLGQQEASLSDDERLLRDTIVAAAATYDPFLYDPMSGGSRDKARRAATSAVLASRNTPEILDLLEQSVGAAFFASDLELTISPTVEQLAGGFGITPQSVIDRAMAMGFDTDPFVSPQTLLDRSKAEAEWYIDLRKTQLSEIGALDMSERPNFFAGETVPDITVNIDGEDITVAADARVPLDRLLEQPLEARRYGDRLVIVGVDDDAKVTNLLDIVLDGEVQIESPLDVVRVAVDALAGVRHTIRGETLAPEQAIDPGLFSKVFAPVGWAIDKAGRAVDNVNAPWNFAVATVQNVLDGQVSVSSEDFRSTTTLKADERRQQAEQIVLNSQRGFARPESIMSFVAQQMIAENPGLSPMGAATLAAGFLSTPQGQEIQAKIQAAADTMPSEDIIAQVESTLDDDSGLKGLLDSGLGLVGEIGAVYGKMLDWTAVHLIDTLGDIGQGTLGAIGLGGSVDYDGPAGFEAFKNTWEWTDAERVSELWGIDDPYAAMWVDVAVNFLIDPLMWFAPSQAARAANWADAMSDPIQVRRFINNASTRKMAEGLLEANAKGDSTFIRMVTKTMAPEHRLALLNSPLKTVEEVQDILFAASPAGGGLWIPNWGGRMATRNSSLQLLKWAEAIRDGGIKGKTADFLLEAFGGFSRSRRISLNQFSGFDDLDDLIINLYAGDMEKANELSSRLMDMEMEAERLGRAERAVAGVSAAAVGEDAYKTLRQGFIDDIKNLIDVDELNSLFKGKGPIEDKVAELLKNARIAQRDTPALRQELKYLNTKVRNGTATDLEVARVRELQEQLPLLSNADTRFDALLAERRGLTNKTKLTDDEIRRLSDINKEISQMKKKLPITRGLLAKAEAQSDLLARYEQYMEDYKNLQRQAETARAAAYKAPLARVEDDLERFVMEIEHEYATEVLGVGTKAGTRNPVTNLPELDWEGFFKDMGLQPPKRPVPQSNVSRLSPFEEFADDMAKSGTLASKSYTYLTLPPEQMVALRILKDDPGLVRKMMAESVVPAEANWATKAKRQVQQLWFLAVLANPRVAIRASLDEIGRHIYHGGMRANRSFRSFRPGFGQEPVRALKAGSLPERSQAATNAADTGLGMTTGAESWNIAARKGSNIADALVSDKVHREAAFRWINGQLIGDDASHALAESARATAEARGISVLEVLESVPVTEWVDDAFTEYWMREGRFVAQAPFSASDNVPLAGKVDAMRVQANGFAALANMSDAPAEVAEWLLERVATRRELARSASKDEAMIRRLGPMPTSQATVDTRGVGDKIMEFMYGKPGRRRFGFFHADYYDRALSVFEKADSLAGGRVLTPQHLVEFGVSPNLQAAEAFMLRNGDEANRIARQHGLWTPRMVEAVADKFARQQALNLMYTPGATSMLGRRIQRVSPFGPAQYDWLQYWGMEATKAATVGFMGKFEWEIPNIFNLKAMSGKVQEAVGMAARGGTELGALPLNLRLAARAGEYAAMYEKVEGQEGLFLPSTVLDELTFFPRLDNSQNFMIDMGPSFGPLPTWALRVLTEHAAAANPEGPFWERFAEALGDTLTALSPALEFQDSDGVEGLIRSFLPSYTGSPLDLLDTIRQTFQVVQGDDYPWSTSRLQTSDEFDRSPYLREALDYGLMTNIRDWGNGDLTDFIDPQKIYDDAQEFAAKRELRDSILAMLPFGRSFGGFEDLTTDEWQGFVEELPALVEAGLMGSDIAGNIESLYAKHQDGTISPSEREELHDRLRNELFGLRDLPDGDRIQSIVLNKFPELAVVMTSRYECRLDPNTGLPVDSDLCNPDGSPNLPAGDAGRRLFNENVGTVFVERKLPERLMEIQWRVANAKRNLLRETYMSIMGETSFRPGSDAEEAQYQGATVSLSDRTVEKLRSYGVDAYDGMPATEFARETKRINEALSKYEYPENQSWQGGRVWNRILRDDYGAQAMDDLDDLYDVMVDRGFGDDVADWPADAQQAARDTFGAMVAREIITPEDYNGIFTRKWGPLEWEPTLPGPLATIEPEFVYDFDSSDIFVIDGDTVDVMTATGPLRFRLIGVNAPDDPMPGAAESFTDLYDLIKTEGYNDIQLVVWKPELFGTTAGTNFTTGEPRLKAWLFVNGQPIFHEDTFTFRNPTGRGSGAVYRPLPRPGGE